MLLFYSSFISHLFTMMLDDTSGGRPCYCVAPRDVTRDAANGSALQTALSITDTRSSGERRGH